MSEKTVYRLDQERDPVDIKGDGANRFRREYINRWIATQTADALANRDAGPTGPADETPTAPRRKETT